MNKSELIAALAEKTEFSKKDAEKALNAFVDAIAPEEKVKQAILANGAVGITFHYQKRYMSRRRSWLLSITPPILPRILTRA